MLGCFYWRKLEEWRVNWSFFYYLMILWGGGVYDILFIFVIEVGKDI